MELKIKPHPKNNFPLRGVLIKNASAAAWIRELQLLQLNLQEISIYPVPGTTANSIWGCLVLMHIPMDARSAGKNELCQRIAPNFFIPERSVLHPALTVAEIEKLFSAAPHLFHPEVGLVELTEMPALETLLVQPVIRSYHMTKPERAVFIPKQVKSFQVKPVPPEDVLKNLEENIFPKREKMKDAPLSLFEKGKLAFYKLLFTKKESKGQNNEPVKSTEKTGLLSKLESFFSSFSKKESKWGEKMQQDFEDLDKRNQKQIDKLMDLFKNDPEEALKYAIPLDDNGSNRGGEVMQFDLSKRWLDLSLLGGSTGSGSGSINLGEHYHQLQKQYNATAQAFMDQGEYHKAAFVYMKLLKNYHMAAHALETGHHYQEAATIYLKHSNNKTKAAECYEKGKMTTEAIDLYKELNQNEKVGDLYISIHKRKEADVFFEKVVDEYKSKNQYVKAALIYKNKMDNETRGQSLLLEGWRNNKDASNCLNNYFSNIHDVKLLKKEIDQVYANDVTPQNSETFLQVMRHEYNKKNELAEPIREMAYEIIAAQLATNPGIVSEMKGFNKNDPELTKDTLRFKLGRRK